MKTLVIGGTSGLAKYLLQALLKTDDALTVVTRRPWHNPVPTRIRHIRTDLSEAVDPEEVEWGGHYDRAIFIPNLILAPNAVQAFTADRLVFLSSYNTRIFGESAAYAPYIEAERHVLSIHPHATILQPTLMTGRGNDLGLCRMIRLAQRLPVIPLIRADALSQPLHLKDLSLAVLHALNEAEPHPGRYGVGGPEVVSQTALFRAIFKALGKRPRFINLPRFAGTALSSMPTKALLAQQVRRAMTDKHVAPEHALPGFAPKIGLDEMIGRTIDAMTALENDPDKPQLSVIPEGD